MGLQLQISGGRLHRLLLRRGQQVPRRRGGGHRQRLMLQHFLIRVRRLLVLQHILVGRQRLLLLMLQHLLVGLQRLRQLLVVLVLLMSAERLMLHRAEEMSLLQIVWIQGTHLHVEVGREGIKIVVETPLHYARRKETICGRGKEDKTGVNFPC